MRHVEVKWPITEPRVGLAGVLTQGGRCAFELPRSSLPESEGKEPTKQQSGAPRFFRVQVDVDKPCIDVLETNGVPLLDGLVTCANVGT